MWQYNKYWMSYCLTLEESQDQISWSKSETNQVYSGHKHQKHHCNLPAGDLWPQMWCAAPLCPTGSHIKPGNNTQEFYKTLVLLLSPWWPPAETSALLTGNLVNKSVNIWAVRGLFLLLMKEHRASLKSVDTRSTSTFPINLSCTHTQIKIKIRLSYFSFKSLVLLVLSQ